MYFIIKNKKCILLKFNIKKSRYTCFRMLEHDTKLSLLCIGREICTSIRKNVLPRLLNMYDVHLDISSSTFR